MKIDLLRKEVIYRKHGSNKRTDDKKKRMGSELIPENRVNVGWRDVIVADGQLTGNDIQ